MLNISSCYAISRSVIKIDALVKACAKKGLPYVAICDEDFFGLPGLIQAAKNNQLKPVFGYRQTTEEGVFSFFIKQKQGYLTLLRFTNGLLTMNDLFEESDLIKVFTGKKDNYLGLLEKIPDLYYGVDEASDCEDIERPVFFRTINTLQEEDAQALELIQAIGKVDEQEKEPPQSFEMAIKMAENTSMKKPFTNMEKIVEEIQPYDLTTDYEIPLLETGDHEDEILYQRCQRRMKEKDFHLDQDYQKRFEHEYAVITQMGFSRYLLLAADIVDTARELGAWVGPGRGSAVSSLLVFLLGITQVDPIRNGLIFERFLSLDREDEPDIDIDVEDEMRQDLLTALRKRYSKERMVHVITFGTYGEKLVMRELSKHFNIDQHHLIREKYQHLISTMMGLPHHLSTHAAGFIFSQEDLREMIPLRELSDDAFMTQYDMNALKECGLFKMDILGLITLSLLKRMGISFEALDTQDEKVYQQIHTDNLCGIFQLDSKTGRKLTEAFTPCNFDEIRILISINRPGPSQSGLTEELINRRNGIKKVEYYHPLVKEILSKTWGVPVYQEQIMEMSMKLAGFSAGQANELRKAMAKKDQSIMNRLKVTFINGASENNMERVAAEELFEMMAEFAGYAFNKAHATAYGLITYWMAYTKYHRPLSFYKTMIDASHGKYPKLYRLINEARQNGIKVLAPDINNSDFETIIEKDALRLGFNLVKDLNAMTVKVIGAERQRDRFTSVEDFILRLDKNILSDFIMKRMMEAHLFHALPDQLTLDDMIRIRDKNAKTLEKIGAKLFGEATNPDGEQDDTQSLKRYQPNLIHYLQEEMNSYGFVINTDKIFGIAFDPFINTDINLGMITNALKANRFETNDGIDYSVIHPSVKLKEGTRVLTIHHGNQSHFKGWLDGNNGEIVIRQSNLSELESVFSERKETIKKAGLKTIKIMTKQYNLEVLL